MTPSTVKDPYECVHTTQLSLLVNTHMHSGIYSLFARISCADAHTRVPRDSLHDLRYSKAYRYVYLERSLTAARIPMITTIPTAAMTAIMTAM